MGETGGLALFNDQRPDQPTAQLFAAADVRVIPIATGIRHTELVIEIFARLHWQLRNVWHAVHLQRQADAMPVNGRLDRQLVDEAQAQPLALPHPQFGARRRTAKRPGRCLVARDQFYIQRRSDQHEVRTRLRLATPHPVTRSTTRAKADYSKTGDACEDLTTGKGHERRDLENDD